MRDSREVLSRNERDELNLTSARGEKVEVRGLNDWRSWVKIHELLAKDASRPKRSADGVWVYREDGASGRLDRATFELVLFDGYPYTGTTSMSSRRFPLPVFFESEPDYNEALRDHMEFFTHLTAVLKEHPGGWLSIPGKWGVRISDRSSLKLTVETNKSMKPNRTSLVFEKVPVSSAIAA